MHSLHESPSGDAHVPLISVALPVYNGEQYLAEAIDSILVQTFSDFELIIIDDGSTDGSLAILQQYQKRDARIRLISRENRNLATTLNELIEVARGAWIARMDQDDIALPHRFERQLRWLEQTGADITGSWVRYFGTSDKRIIPFSKTDDAIKMEMLFGSPFAHPTIMMRSALAKQLRYDKTWEKAEDYDLWERVARGQWRMTNVPEVLLLYRQHPLQISSNTYNRQQMLGQKIRHRYWEYIFDRIGCNKRWIDEALKLREPTPPVTNMDEVDAAFYAILESIHGEAREVVLRHATKLYFRAAAICPDVLSRLNQLHARFGSELPMSIRLKLWLISSLRLYPESFLFKFLKKLHVVFSR